MLATGSTVGSGLITKSVAVRQFGEFEQATQNLYVPGVLVFIKLLYGRPAEITSGSLMGLKDEPEATGVPPDSTVYHSSCPPGKETVYETLTWM